jgi:hypothetical protein
MTAFIIVSPRILYLNYSKNYLHNISYKFAKPDDLRIDVAARTNAEAWFNAPHRNGKIFVEVQG